MELKYSLINKDDEKFKTICGYLEKHVVSENHKRNGGKLQHDGLTYDSDILLLCTDGFIPVGFNSLIILNEDVYIYQIAVKEAYKRKGIASQLLVNAIEIAEMMNRNVSADVRDNNKVSQRLFEKNGFTRNQQFSTDEAIYYEMPVEEVKRKLR